MTFGEKAVGLSFNPSGDPRVDDVKRRYASIIDRLHEEKCLVGHDPARVRLFSIAVTEAQTAQMWAVKALTWREEMNDRRDPNKDAATKTTTVTKDTDYEIDSAGRRPGDPGYDKPVNPRPQTDPNAPGAASKE